MRNLTLFILFILLACSKDTPLPTVNTFTLSVAASEGGSVDISGGTYNENSNVSITATPAQGYAFSEWTGDATGSTNPLSVSMTSDKNITASFIRLQYSLGVNTIGSGTVSQVLVESTEKNTDYDSFSTVRLNATPSSGWIFTSWSGSSTSTVNPIDLIIDKTKTITATFVECTTISIGPLDITSIDVTQVGCDNTISIIALNIQNIQPPLGINWFQYKATTSTFVATVTGATTTASTLDWIPLTSLDQNTTVSELPEGIYRAEVSDGRSGNCGGTLRTRDILLQESSIQIVNFRTIENFPTLCNNYETSFTTDVLFRISENLNRNLGSNSFQITLLSKSGTVITNPAAWDLNNNNILDPQPQSFVYRYPNLQADQYTLSVTESLPASSTLTACSEVYFFDIQDYLPITYIGQTVFETDICTGLVEEIEALASGGVPFIVNGLPSYQFEWTYTPIDPTQSQSKFFGQTLTNVPAGNYCVKITDKNGCSYDSCDTSTGATPLTIVVNDVVTPFSVTGNLTDPTDLSVQVKSLPPDCSSGGLDGRIGVVLSGGLLPKEINWFIEDPTSLTSASNPGYQALPGNENRTSLDSLVPGNYKMVVTSLNPDAVACAKGGNFINNDYLYYEEIIQVTPNRELFIIDGPFVDADFCSGNFGRVEVEVFDNNNGNLSFYYNGILIPSSDVIRLNNDSWSIAIVNTIESADLRIVNEEGCGITATIDCSP